MGLLFDYLVMPSCELMNQALGMGTTSVASFLCVRVFKTHPIDQSKPVPVSNLVVLGATTALALCLGQYPYLYLTVAFIQMLKAFSPTYMVIFLALLGVEQPSRRIVLITVGLSAFTALASAGEVNFNLVGVSFMVAASTADAVRLVVAQKLLKNLNLAPMEALYYTSPITLGWMGLAVFTELPDVWRTSAHAIVGSHPVLFCVAGLSGFVINLSGFLLVKRTSGMTLKILTMSRNGGLVLVSAVVFGETITRLEAFGYSGLLVCFALYTFEKMRPEAPPPPHAGDGAGHEDQDVEQRWSLRTPNSPTSSRGGSPDGSPRGPTMGSAWRGGYEAPPATAAMVHGVESESESR